jgi:hypothetical protein
MRTLKSEKITHEPSIFQITIFFLYSCPYSAAAVVAALVAGARNARIAVLENWLACGVRESSGCRLSHGDVCIAPHVAARTAHRHWFGDAARSTAAASSWAVVLQSVLLDTLTAGHQDARSELAALAAL